MAAAASLAAGGAVSSAATAMHRAHSAGATGKRPGKPIKIKLVRTVNARTLPRPTSTKPFSEPDETGPVSGKGVRTTNLVRFKPTKPAAAGPHASPAITEPVSVTGQSRMGGVPPDTQVAEGGSWVVEETNAGLDVFNLHGNLLAARNINNLFFGLRYAGFGSDPKIVYDQASQEFFSTYIRVLPDHSSIVYLGAARDPLGSWTIYAVSVESGLQDQPKLGFSSDKIVISWNDYNWNSAISRYGPFLGEEYVVLLKHAVVSGAVPPADGWPLDPNRFNVVPAVQTSRLDTAYAIYHRPGTSTVGVLTFTGLPGATSVASFTDTRLGIGGTNQPPGAAQPGTQVPLDTVGDRIQSAAWDNGNLWAAGNDACRYPTDTAPRSCLRVIHIDTTTMRVLRDVDITLVGGSLMDPAVVLDKNGNLWLAFSASSASLFASAAVAEANGGTIGTSIGGAIYRTGIGPINNTGCTGITTNRFGDYSGAAVNYASGAASIWAAAEWGTPSTNPCDWSTQIAEFTP